VRLAIAPVDSDAVILGDSSVYDVAVGGGALNHTSIMDPLVQASTELRYGRSKIFNAYGSEQFSLVVPIAIQYWNGSAYVAASDDATTSLLASYIALSAPLGSLTAATGASATGTCFPTPLPQALSLSNGLGKFCLARPGVPGSVNLSTTAPAYLPSTGVSVPRATFGVYKSPLIYRRENY
jgi:MSHA biogenesis protein MshQ